MRLKALLLGCLLAGASVAQIPGPYGVFGGPIPSYLLPSGAPLGSTAFTSDYGMMVSNGTTWAVNTSTSSIPANTVLGSVAGGAPGALTVLPGGVSPNVFPASPTERTVQLRLAIALTQQLRRPMRRAAGMWWCQPVHGTQRYRSSTITLTFVYLEPVSDSTGLTAQPSLSGPGESCTIRATVVVPARLCM